MISDRYNLLIVAAFLPEIDKILEFLKEKKHSRVTASVIGVGGNQAAMNVHSKLLQHSLGKNDGSNANAIDEIILIGSCGLYHDHKHENIRLGSSIISSSFTAYDLAFIEKKASIPRLLPSIIECTSGRYAKEIAKGIAEDAAKEIAKETAKGTAKDAAKGTAKEIAKGIAKDAAKGIAKDAAKDAAKGIAKDAAKGIAKGTAKEIAKDAAKGIAKDIAKGAAKDAAKGTAKGIAKDAAKDDAKETDTRNKNSIIINSTNSISHDVSAAGLAFLESKNVFAENLESFALAQLSSYYKIPFASLLIASNRINAQASEDWRKNHREMSSKLQNFILQILE